MPRLKPFQDALPMLDVVHPIPDDSGGFRLAIAARQVSVRLHQALPATTVWSYRLDLGTVARQGSGASYLGPIVEVQRGQQVAVDWKNEIPSDARLPLEVIKVPNADAAKTLPVPQNEPGRDGALPDAKDPTRHQARSLRAALVTHLHGGRTPSYSDGLPDETMLPGQFSRYVYPNDQAATMLWYHDHAMNVTRLHIYSGLSGLWLIRDAEEAQLDLPGGTHELALVIQDRNLDLDIGGGFSGALLHKTEVGDGPMEFFGPYTLVNGVIWPRATVEPSLYRLRLLNGSNARTYRLLLLDEKGHRVNRAIWQIGCDQGLMQRKAPLDEHGLLIAPAERVDLLVDFAGYEGQQLYVWNTAEAPFGNEPTKRPDTARVVRELQALLDDPLASADLIDPSNAINRRPFPQVMRFDVAGAASGSSCRVPGDPLWKTPRVPLSFDANTVIRLMALIEEPPADPARPDATSMLVFWEYVSADIQPTPPGTTPVSFTFRHPGTGVRETRQFWKAAERFYDRINWRVHLGSTEVWYIVNLSDDTHPIHVHLVDFHVHERTTFMWNGKGELDPSSDTLTRIEIGDPLPLEPGTQGPKDTIRVNPGEAVGIAMRFAPFAGRYIYHCHILEHEDHDMMRPFVIAPEWVPHHMY